MTDAPSPYAAPTAQPVQPVVQPIARTTAAVLPVTIGLTAAAVVGAVVNLVFGGMFPGNAPVEQIYAFGVTVDLVAVALAVGIRALIIFRMPRGAASGTLSVLGIIAAALGLIVFVGWIVIGGAEYWTGGMSRYMTGAGPLFFLGIPWVVSLVLGEVALRRSDSTINSALSIGTLVLGGIVGILTIAATVIYGLGLSA
jgi:hypothetical protein